MQTRPPSQGGDVHSNLVRGHSRKIFWAGAYRQGGELWKSKEAPRYDTIRYDIRPMYLECSKKLTCSELSPPPRNRIRNDREYGCALPLARTPPRCCTKPFRLGRVSSIGHCQIQAVTDLAAGPSPSANSNVFIIIISSSNSRGKLGLSEDLLADQSWWSMHKSVKVQWKLAIVPDCQKW